MTRLRLLVVPLLLSSLMAGSQMALAASTTLYLRGDFEPQGTMAISAPPAQALPNFDPGRDDEPGLLLKKSSGYSESDPTKYQQWEFDASG